MLASFVLATDDHTSWKVCQSNSRVRLVDVLTSRTRRSVGVDAKVLLVNLNFTDIFQKWRDVDRGKRGLTTVL
jgi:hypothetical protein